MEVKPLEVKSKWSEMCGMKSWEGPRAAKYVELHANRFGTITNSTILLSKITDNNILQYAETQENIFS
jgi:hypothetical protein